MQEQITPKEDFRPDNVQTEFDVPKNYGLMTIEGVGAIELNLPPAVIGNSIYGLPPYGPRRSFLVDEWKNCPAGWERSTVKDGVPYKSFFVPVRAGRGLWLDLNPTYMHQMHNYHVAALVSIQGINAITGQKLKGGDVRLEQYIEKCPAHDVSFGPDRYCEQCGFKWPKQNYLCGNEHRMNGTFWIDGFRCQDGEVRQFIFTEEEMRSVAKAVLGDDRCWAIGVAFYLSKDPIPEPPRNILRSFGLNFSDNTLMGGPTKGGGGQKSSIEMPASWHNNITDHTFYNNVVCNTLNDGHTTECEYFDDAEELTLASAMPVAAMAAGVTSDAGDSMTRSIDESKEKPEDDKMSRGRITRMAAERKRVKLEVGAGAKINQKFFDDPNDLTFWREKPSGVIIVTYCDEDMCREIINGEKVDMTGGGEGFLKDIPHGNL